MKNSQLLLQRGRSINILTQSCESQRGGGNRIGIHFFIYFGIFLDKVENNILGDILYFSIGVFQPVVSVSWLCQRKLSRCAIQCKLHHFTETRTLLPWRRGSCRTVAAIIAQEANELKKTSDDNREILESVVVYQIQKPGSIFGSNCYCNNKVWTSTSVANCRYTVTLYGSWDWDWGQALSSNVGSEIRAMEICLSCPICPTVSFTADFVLSAFLLCQTYDHGLHTVT